MKASIARAILIISLVHLGVCFSDEDISDLKRQTSSGDNLEPSTRLEKRKQLSERDQEGETKRLTGTTRQRASPIQNLGNEAQTTQTLPFTIIEARREAVGEGIKLTVKYGSNDTTILASWDLITENRGEGTDTAVGNDEYETSVLIPASELQHIIAENSFYDRIYLATVQLYTDTYGEGVCILLYYGEDAVEREIPVPFFEVVPAGDFVYEEGEDVIRKILVGESSRHWLISYITYLDLDTGDVVLDFGYNHVLLNGRSQISEGDDEVTLQIDTSESRISGLLTMEYFDYTTFSGPVVSSVNYVREVTVRPATQAGPFPDGYLGFVKSVPDYIPMAGHNITKCKVGQTCRMDCVVAGSDITKVTVEKLGNSGTFETLDQEKYDIEEITKPYLKQKVVRFQVDSVPGKSDLLRCTAQNAEGKTIVMESTVMVIIPLD